MSGPIRNRIILIAELPLLALAAFLAFAVRFDLRFYTTREEFLGFLGLALVVKPLVFFAFGLYSRIWRHASVNDLFAVVLGVASASIVTTTVVLVAQVFRPELEFSRAVLLVDALLTLVLAGGLRMSLRVFQETRPRFAGALPVKRVLIAGAGDAGAMVVREIKRNPQLGLTVVGLLDDNRATHGQLVLGSPVLGDTGSLERLAASHQIDELIIAMPTAPGATIRALSDASRRTGIEPRMVPGVYELLDGKVTVSRLRHVEIDDLLRRAPIAPRGDPSPYLAGQVVLVTGAGGSIGFELCRQVSAARPRQLIMLGHGENSLFEARSQILSAFPGIVVRSIVADIRDAGRMRDVFDRHRPAVVFHAAAHKHVALMEENPGEAVTNNVIGTQNVVDAGLQAGVQRLVLISSDKAVAPSSIMGATKRAAEFVVADAVRRGARGFSVVRFGNVLGSRGSVVPIFKRQIEQGGPVTITHPDVRRYFMTIPEAVHLVLQAGGLGPQGGLYVLEMGEPIRIVDLATDLIRLSGFTTAEIPIAVTGLRQGEKLSEMLWEADALVEPTACPGVLRVVEPDGSHDVPAMIESLRRAALTGNRTQIEAELVRWVSSFGPTPPLPAGPASRLAESAVD